MAPERIDPWHYPRTEYAESLLGLLKVVPALTLYSPRRTGKTQFVSRDLIPAARRSGYEDLYIDLWQNKADVAQRLVNGFRQKLDAIQVPSSRAGKTLNQEVTGVRALGFGIQLGDAPTGYVPPDTLSQIQYWLDAVVNACDKPLFLVIDEAQQIAATDKDQNVAAALRSALQAHGHGITQFFTGSSQDQLARMFDDAAAPFYQHAQRLDLPSFDRDFTDSIAGHFERSTGRTLDLDALWDAFMSLDTRPGPFREMINAMMIDHASTDIAAALQSQHHVENERSRQMLISKDLSPLQMAVAARIAYGLDIAGQSALAYYATITGESRVHITTAQRAATHLWNSGLVQKRNRGYAISSNHVSELLRERFPELNE